MGLVDLVFLGTPLWMWGMFLTLVVALLAFDLGVLHRKDHVIGVRESIFLSSFYIGLGLLFGVWILFMRGEEAAMLYLTGFVVEKSLAMDNIFVIAMIFSYFAIPARYQHRVLIYGILGVVILRGLMIGAGVAIVTEFHWVLYLFAIFLVLTGIKMLRAADESYDIASNPVLRGLRKWLPLTKELHGHKFIIRTENHFLATPLLLTLLMIETADVLFAVDSIPAIFSITTDPYLIYTSNIFAILGLRALYFLLVAMLGRFRFLKQVLSLILIFIGSKIFLADLFGWEKFPPELSLLITLGLLVGGISINLLVSKSAVKR